jgi:alcohol dehydrogenase
MLPRSETVDFVGPEQLRFGAGTVEETGQYCARHGNTALVVTDPGVRAADLVDPVADALTDADVDSEVFDGVDPDPTVSNALACAERARAVGADSLVGVGGGSSMDVAKAASAVLTNDVPVGELLGRHQVPTAGLPTVLLPTTAGTGSEVSPAAVLYDDRAEGSGEKVAIIDHGIFADAAVVDPDLSMHLPSAITRATGLDAFAHAIGSYMSTDSNTFADALCVEAMALIEEHLRDATFHGAEAPAAREKMALAATMAMLGRVNGGKAAIHSIALGVQAMYDVPHGEAIAMVLPEIVEYNLPATVDELGRLGTRLYGADGPSRDRAERLVEGLYDLRADVGLDRSLRDIGASEGDMPELAELATHSERHLDPNPRPIDVDDATAILRSVW